MQIQGSILQISHKMPRLPYKLFFMFTAFKGMRQKKTQTLVIKFYSLFQQFLFTTVMRCTSKLILSAYCQ